jgi:hypothetical protein
MNFLAFFLIFVALGIPLFPVLSIILFIIDLTGIVQINQLIIFATAIYPIPAILFLSIFCYYLIKNSQQPQYRIFQS